MPMRHLLSFALVLILVGTVNAGIVLDPVPATGSFNVISNGGFETGTMASWSVFNNPAYGVFAASSQSSYSGNWSAKTVPNANFTGAGYDAISAPITVTPGVTYVLSAFFNTASMSESALYLDLGDVPFEVQPGNYYSPTSARIFGPWFFSWDSFTVPTNVSTLQIRMIHDGSGGTNVFTSDVGYVDSVAITPVSQFSPPTAVPEPSSFVFGGMAVAAIVGRFPPRWRNKQL